MNLIERGQITRLNKEIEKFYNRMTSTQIQFLKSICFLQTRIFEESIKLRSVKFMLDLEKLNKAEGNLYCNSCQNKECCKTEPDSNEYCIFFDIKKMKCSVYANRPIYCRLWVCTLFSKEDIAKLCNELNIMQDVFMLNLKSGDVSKVS